MQTWIEEALVSLQLNPEYCSWLNHRFVTFKKDPAVAGRLGADLSRATVEKYGPDIDAFRDRVGEDYTISEKHRDQFYADFNAMGAAYEILKRFQKNTRLEFHQGTIPFPVSVPPPAPIMGPEAELNFKQEAGDQEIAGQVTETATEVPAIESSETSEASAELHEWEAGIVQINLFVQNSENVLRRATFEEIGRGLVERCQASYQQLQEETNPARMVDHIHAQKLAKQWAAEIELDQEIRSELDAILVRSLRRLGQLRAALSKNGDLKRGKGSAKLFLGLDKNALHQSDKLAKIEDDEDFETRLRKKIANKELTKYSSLEDPQTPKEQPESRTFYALLARIRERPIFYQDGKWIEENPHEWAEHVMGGGREMIRSFALKLLELLGPQ